MKNSFDLLIDGLVKEYGIPAFPDKNHEDEIYCFEFGNGISIKIYQDNNRWVYFLAETGQAIELDEKIMTEMLFLNSFSFKKPFFSLGINSQKMTQLHTRVPLVEVNNIEMRGIFENILNVATEIRKKFNLT
ncbi:CesT family type III secretion system chaperone [Erwinia psidii]|uniref:Type III chaperone protein ShcF n=1 Tax=Erwinia psidii TaxID=69224 RepID=A0A3N6TS61_9GAMM|nr:CesT family type III secretion system chaperone [Erwinia psidii]MCX8958188.1 type III chaperone protein ShcF [Erwinia psidii]MCX8963133.1 type III chaperone protein ShcF [Erwinia psidii]RQM38082.1 type III chaperone protein ShcF [Erwinia psidii]